MRILARRTVTGFVPADDQALAQMRRVPVGKIVYLEIVAARNPRQHRLLFALLTILCEAGEFPGTDAALTALKIATGHVDSFQMKGEEPHFVVKSVSFANMRQAEFEPWFKGALEVVSKRWLNGIKSEELRHEIEQMVG